MAFPFFFFLYNFDICSGELFRRQEQGENGLKKLFCFFDQIWEGCDEI